MADIVDYDPSGPDSEIVAQFTLRKADLCSLDAWLMPAIATAIEAWTPYMTGIPASETDEASYRATINDMLAKLRLAADDAYCVDSDIFAQVRDGLTMLVDILPGLWF